MTIDTLGYPSLLCSVMSLPPYTQLANIARIFKVKIFYIIPISFALVFFYQSYASQTTYKLWLNHKVYKQYGPRIVNSARGWLSYSVLEEDVFKPHGYRIFQKTDLIPKLEFAKPRTCDQIFVDWTAVASYTPRGPLLKLPQNMSSMFHMFGTARKAYKFRDDSFPSSGTKWDMDKLWAEYSSLPEDELYTIGNYYTIGMSVYYAMSFHKEVVKDKAGLVIGSHTPWAEYYALSNGASSVTTVDYQEIHIKGNNQMHFVHAMQFAKDYKKHMELYDFAVSFSSIEHSGLGRYGDPIDPIGDLKEVRKIACTLKRGGYFFLGLPRGQDAVVYNLHRVYGRIRLAMIMTGFEWVSTFRGTSKTPVTVTLDDLDGLDSFSGYYQDLFVLRKL